MMAARLLAPFYIRMWEQSREVVMTILSSLFGTLLFTSLVAAGLLLIVVPSWGRVLLKKTAVFTGLFLFGIALLQVCCSMLRRGW